MIRLGPPHAECIVVTRREGLLAGLGHDLELAVARFDVRIDEAKRTVDASFDAASLRVVRAFRDSPENTSSISDADRRTIEDNLRRDVLETNRHPEVRFRSTRVVDAGDGFDVTGRLTLHGKEREIVVPMRRAGDRYVGEVTLRQPDFGIKPYAVLLGAIKVRPEVTVRISVPAAPPPSG
jgi:polyisoprenoid-binding protein YceI